MYRVGNGLLTIAVLLVVSLVAAGPATAKDRNHDRIPDRWEKRHGLSLKVNQAKRDQDHDALNNRGEFRSGNDPHDSDSDDDGTEDGDENAGVIASFDGTTLTIDLLNGGSITGTVNAETEVECGGECHGDHDHSGPSDNSGRGSGSSGHDDDDVDEPGDDDDIDEDIDEDVDEDVDEDEDAEEEGDCSIDDLTVGGTVREAELRLKNGDAVYTEIELAE